MSKEKREIGQWRQHRPAAASSEHPSSIWRASREHLTSIRPSNASAQRNRNFPRPHRCTKKKTNKKHAKSNRPKTHLHIVPSSAGGGGWGWVGGGGFDDEKETKNATKQQQRQQKTKKIETPSGDDILMAVARYRHRSTDNGNRIEEPRTPKEKQRERERERRRKKQPRGDGRSSRFQKNIQVRISVLQSNDVPGRFLVKLGFFFVMAGCRRHSSFFLTTTGT